MDPGKYEEIGKDQIFDAFNNMGIDNALDMDGASLAGMFGAMDPEGIGQLARFQILSAAVGNIQPD